MIERGFADQLKVRVGSRVTLDDRPFQVVGIAVDTDHGANWRPQLVWVTRADVPTRLASDQLAYVVNLRLADPARAPLFAAAHSSPSLFIATWQLIRSSDEKKLSVVQIVLLLGTWLLGVLAIGSVAVLVGGRMVEQTKRVGLIKAAGGTPEFVAVVLLAENLFLALAATVIPALRAARASTVRVLSDLARTPGRHGTMVALAARLPASLVLGILLLVRRPRRVILTTLSLVITDVMVVCALALHSSSSQRSDVMVNQPGLGDPLLARVDSVVAVVTVILVVLATINTIFITQATVLDAQRPSALARAFGATPGQVNAGLTVAQLLPALLAGILSIPAGPFVYRVAARAAGSGSHAALPPSWMAAVVVGTAVAVALLTLIPARAAARRPIAVALAAD